VNIADYIIVGSGVTGATIARRLSDAGMEVLVVERRNHLGGNVHDFVHESGIRVHTYGPHYFRTNSERLWRFVNRFATFYNYEAVVKSLIDRRLEDWPITTSYVARHAPEWKADPCATAGNFEEECLRKMPRLVYEKFVRGYTEKQWGVPARSLDKRLAGRFELRGDDDPRLSRHRFQGIPREGYSAFMTRMLAGIPVLLNVDFIRHRSDFKARKMLVFTGPIDELFDFGFGRLSYRSQKREHEFQSRTQFFQPCAQVNNPSPENGAYIRTIEWKHIMPRDRLADIAGTVLTREFPFSPSEPDLFEYPFPDSHNAALFQKYQERAAKIPDVLICGRLGEYRYYDMDQAIARAMMLSQRLIEFHSVPQLVSRETFGDLPSCR
jgi:UDP-galactopyranose mutase